MTILHSRWTLRIVHMHPVHDRPFVAIGGLRPLCGIALSCADLIQRLKAFPAAFVFRFHPQAAHLFGTLVPFGEIWS